VEPSDKVARKIVTSAKKGIIWSAVNSWTNNILSLAVVTLLARLVSPTEFGLVALASIYISLGQVFISDTVSEALVQRHVMDSGHLDAAFWIMAVLGVFATLAGIAVAPILGSVFSEPGVVPILQVISVRLIFDSLLTVPNALLLRGLDFRSLATRSLFANIGGGAVGIGVALAGGGAWALVSQQLVNAAVTLAVVSASAGWFPRWAFSRTHAGELVGYSSFSVLARLGYFLVNNVDRMIIGFFLTPMALGIYSLAKRVTEMMSASITGVVVAVAHPLFARDQNNIVELRAALTSMMDRTALVAFPAFFGLASIAQDVVPLVFGKKWIAAVPVLQVLSVLMALYAVSTLHGALVRAMGRADWWSGFINLTSALYVIGFAIAGRYGIVAVAGSSLAMFVLISPLHFWMVKRLLNLKLTSYLTIFIVPLAASSAMSLLILLLRSWDRFPTLPLLSRVAAEIATGMATYGLIVAILAPDRTRSLMSHFRRSEASS
jgi:O-antigen/teichoic acid export membrane protein